MLRYEPYFVGGLPASIELDLTVATRDVGHGTNGKVVAFATSVPDCWVAVKMFASDQINQEIEFFGYNQHKQNKQNNQHVERVKYERLLVRCGFVQSLLCKAGRSCKACLACNIKPKKNHYHVVMPLMSTNVHTMLRKSLVDLPTRMHIFSSIACIVQNLADNNILYPDVKLENIVYNQYNQAVLGCDVGALFRLDHRAMWEKQATKFITDCDSTKTVVYANHTSRATPVVSMSATYVNLFLQLDNANYTDLSDATHLTNQFSLLCVLMDLLAIKPPRFTLCRTRKARTQACMYYENCARYVDQMSDKTTQANLANQPNQPNQPIHPRVGAPCVMQRLVQLLVQTWQACNQFQLVHADYASHLGQQVQLIMQDY